MQKLGSHCTPIYKKGTNVAEVWPSLVSGNENYNICSVKWGRTSEWIEALLTKRRQHSGGQNKVSHRKGQGQKSIVESLNCSHPL